MPLLGSSGNSGTCRAGKDFYGRYRMSEQILVVYWSGTGNTEAMAKAVAEGVKSAGADVRLAEAAHVKAADVAVARAVALGCPSMGDEVLEEDEMEPLVASLEDGAVKDKHLVLFGSYDWGDGQWMREWQDRMEAMGAVMKAPGLIAHLEPGAADLEACRGLGRTLAGA